MKLRRAHIRILVAVDFIEWTSILCFRLSENQMRQIFIIAMMSRMLSVIVDNVDNLCVIKMNVTGDIKLQIFLLLLVFRYFAIHFRCRSLAMHFFLFIIYQFEFVCNFVSFALIGSSENTLNATKLKPMNVTKSNEQFILYLVFVSEKKKKNTRAHTIKTNVNWCFITFFMWRGKTSLANGWDAYDVITATECD